MIKIAPSLLAADFGNLEKQIRKVEKGGADWLHLDVMDGHYVPNITFGPHIVASVRKCTRLPLDVHLMIEEPEKFIGQFKDAGANNITVHLEACRNLKRAVKMIKGRGCLAGISINPGTPAEVLERFIKLADLILIMTVEPGFGGQKFMKESIKKVMKVKEMIRRTEKRIFLEVDGGIDLKTAPDVVEAGADVLVAGTSIFGAKSVRRTISLLHKIGK